MYERNLEGNGPEERAGRQCTGAEKMVCNQSRTEVGATHFFGLCTEAVKRLEIAEIQHIY